MNSFFKNLFLPMPLMLATIGGLYSTQARASSSLQPVSIRMINTNAGSIMTAHAALVDGKVYVSGLVHRPPGPALGAHVHVWATDEANRRLFYKNATVLVTGKPSFIQTESYVVSFEPDVFERANILYITFRGETDAESRDEMRAN